MGVIKRLLNRLFVQSIDRSLRAKITLGIIIPMVLMLFLFTIFEYTRHRSVLLNSLSVLASYNGQLIEQTLRKSMLVSDFAEVQRTLDTVKENENFRVVYFLNTSGRVIFAPNGEGIGIQLDNRNPTCQPCHKLPTNERPNGIVVDGADGQRVFRSMHPIENSPACSGCHDPKQRLIGVLLTDISVEPFEADFVRDLRENMLWGGSIILISAVFANLVMGKLVVRRLSRVAEALARFGSGQRDIRLFSGSRDEIGRLEADFDEMEELVQVEGRENRLLSDDLQKRTAQQQELLKSLITAQEDERKRVARELHDEIGQTLSGLALHSEVIERLIREDPDRALRQLKLSRELIDRTTQQMYELILALRPSMLDDLGLAAALHAHAERVFNDSGITFNLETSGLTRRLPASIETALYRIFQEAMSNVLKHSEANQVAIILSQIDGVFTGEIADNGRGFDLGDSAWEASSPRGLGLLGMQERVAQCGGTVDVFSKPGEGTRIHIHIPLVETQDE